ncbi:MAG: FHA domain-containing protein [Planctomycetes bacterium]|nr:FHA domain-containing protein [Planctomycetota bacterium]
MNDTRSDLIAPTDRPVTRPRPALRWVGVLARAAGALWRDIRVEGDELILGRDAGCGAVLPDESVSGRHARITRNGDEFVLEDLDSCNGTHVDGVPIVSCVLHDGDIIQFGQNLFYFERVLEPVAPAPGGQP